MKSLLNKGTKAIKNSPHVCCGRESSEIPADESLPRGNPWAPAGTDASHGLDVLVRLESMALSGTEHMTPHTVTGPDCTWDGLAPSKAV